MLFAVAFSRRHSNIFLTPRLPLFCRACIFLRSSVCNWIFELYFPCTLIFSHSGKKIFWLSPRLSESRICTLFPKLSCTIFPKCVFWLEGRAETEIIIEQNLGNILLICRLDLILEDERRGSKNRGRGKWEMGKGIFPWRFDAEVEKEK